MGKDNELALLGEGEAASNLILLAKDTVDLVSSYLEKKYYRDMTSLEIKPLDEISTKEVADTVWLYKVDKLAYDNKEGDFAEKLATVVSAVSLCGGTLIMFIEANNGDVSLNIGVRGNAGATDLFTVKDTLKNSFTGNFPGSYLIDLEVDTIAEKLTDCFGDSFSNNCITAISSISGQNKKDGLYRGVENILNSSFDAPFSLLIIADPVDKTCLNEIRNAYENISTQLSKLISVNFSIQQGSSSGKNESKTKSESIQIGKNYNININKSETLSESEGFTKRKNYNKNNGATDMLIGAGSLLSVLSGNVVGLYAMNTVRTLFKDEPDYFEDENSNKSKSKTVQKGSSEGGNKSYTKGEQVSYGTNTSLSEGYSAQYTITNRAAKRLYDKIEEYLEWLNNTENFGMFNVCAYVISAGAGTNMVAASQYEAMMHGTGVGNTYGVNTWTDEKGAQIRRYLSCFKHPVMLHPNIGEVEPSVLVSSNELARHLVFPQKSVAGLSIVKYEPFGRNVIRQQELGVNGDIRVGCINYMGSDISTAAVPVSVDSLSGHLFIAGATRTGKSRAIFSLLNQVHKRGIPFLVIEPAKGEYKKIFAAVKNVSVFSPMLKEKGVLPLRINLFYFREGIDPNEHIEKLVEIFNACWPMYAAMPQVLREAMCRAYEECGWDLENSINTYGRIFPTVKDVCEQIKTVIDQTDFSAEVRGNYIGSLLTRLESLDRGIYKRIFSSGDLGDEQFFEKSTIIDLSRPDATEVKALIMGLLVVRHFEYCVSSAELTNNQELKHLTVLEEAHNLLAPAISTSTEGANMSAKSVEMITRCIAELGGFGHGFIIADQAPGLLDRAVIRNTNTKMIFRLPDMDDCELSGKSIGLRQEQYFELSRLKREICVIHQINWEEAVLCHIKQDLPEGSKKALPLHIEKAGFSIKDYFKCLLLSFSVIGNNKPCCTPKEKEKAVAWAAECGFSASKRLSMIKAVTIPNPNWNTVLIIVNTLVDRHDIFLKAGKREDIKAWTDRAVEAVAGFTNKRLIALTLIEALLDGAIRAGEDAEYFHDTWFDFVKQERSLKNKD